MKKYLLLTVVAVFSLVLAACGGAPDTSALDSQIADLQSQLSQAQDAASAAKDEASQAMADLDAAKAEMAEGGDAMAAGGNTLATVQERGVLKCGTGGGTAPGFGFIQEDGSWAGFNIDFCKAVAQAVLGDAEAIEPILTSGTTRFPILQSGEADMLSNSTTWTFSRDTSLGFNFVPTVFYDGQGMMVLKDSGIETLEDLEGGSVCVATGTTTEKNLASVFRQRDISYEAITFEDPGDVTRSAFEEGRCDGYTSDYSALVGNSVLFADPSTVTILPVVMSKEPLGPLVRHGDDQWFDIVKWTVNCTIQAEEFGITSANVDEMLGSDDPTILSTLGVEGDLGQAIGVDNDFCYQIVKNIGNYGEIFNKHLGPDTPFDLQRGANGQWQDGGLLYSPPFR